MYIATKRRTYRVGIRTDGFLHLYCSVVVRVKHKFLGIPYWKTAWVGAPRDADVVENMDKDARYAWLMEGVSEFESLEESLSFS